jgi:hypothetical protein
LGGTDHHVVEAEMRDLRHAQTAAAGKAEEHEVLPT